MGYENFIPKNMINSINVPKSRPMMKFIKEMRMNDKNKIIDASKGETTNSFIMLDGGFLILSHLQTGTIAKRIMEEEVF
ncbi:DUF370 domain-containing protein [Domibacillus iocasae]|uniref:Uncharacterized protein n=1 Tax=Domibacillus iocasae TaxID=1714016 RepID=A0A1E7DSD6_9BACI|nr:DUF370 domain-containing protein [Domibacillus iocasae]OES45997.1 hypothetical protein BA724_16660 [Domibacillus iocasae]